MAAVMRWGMAPPVPGVSPRHADEMSSGMADALGRPIRPLDVLLVDGALGPLHRLLPGGPGVRVRADPARRPCTAVRRVRDLGGELGQVLLGRSTLAPAERDRRFADDAWRTN